MDDSQKVKTNENVIELLNLIISWEKDLSEYMSLESKIAEKFIIIKKNRRNSKN